LGYFLTKPESRVPGENRDDVWTPVSTGVTTFYDFIKSEDHASTCNICYTQAMRVFLWNELGAREAEMLKALKEIYGE